MGFYRPRDSAMTETFGRAGAECDSTTAACWLRWGVPLLLSDSITCESRITAYTRTHDGQRFLLL